MEFVDQRQCNQSLKWLCVKVRGWRSSTTSNWITVEFHGEHIVCGRFYMANVPYFGQLFSRVRGRKVASEVDSAEMGSSSGVQSRGIMIVGPRHPCSGEDRFPCGSGIRNGGRAKESRICLYCLQGCVRLYCTSIVQNCIWL